MLGQVAKVIVSTYPFEPVNNGNPFDMVCKPTRNWVHDHPLLYDMEPTKSLDSPAPLVKNLQKYAPQNWENTYINFGKWKFQPYWKKETPPLDDEGFFQLPVGEKLNLGSIHNPPHS